MQDQEIVLRLAQTLYDHKAGDISALNVGHLTVLCDTMVIASGRTVNQVSALANEVDEMMAKGFDEGGSGELLDSESNCLYIGGLYDDDLPYVSLYAYDL